MCSTRSAAIWMRLRDVTTTNGLRRSPPGGRKLPRRSPTERSYWIYWQSETSVFLPSTFLTCCALPKYTSKPPCFENLLDRNPVNARGSHRDQTHPKTLEPASALRSRVNVGNLRTDCGPRSAATATNNSLTPTSMPAPSGCNTGKCSHRLLPFLARPSYRFDRSNAQGAKQSKLPIEIAAFRRRHHTSIRNPGPRLHGRA